MDSLLELAERVEALSGPDREVDAAIWETLGLVPEEHCRSWCNMDRRTDLTRTMFVTAWAPSFTASLDAAMSLAGYPNGRPHNVVIATAYGSAYMVPNDGESYGINDPLKGEARAAGDDEIGRASRAVTAACLRARARSTQPALEGQS